MSLGDRIKSAREKAGLSQSALADKLGITQQAVQRAEKNQTAKPKFLPELASALGVSYDFLITGQQNVTYAQGGNTPQPFAVQQSHAAYGADQIRLLELWPGGLYGGQIYKGGTADMVLRPRSLDNAAKAYALYMYDQSMAPRYLYGETLYIHPSKPVSNGDYVAAHILTGSADEAEILVAQLSQRGTNTYVFNLIGLSKALKIEAEKVKALHKIVASGG